MEQWRFSPRSQPRKARTHQQLGVKAIGLGAAVLARHRNAGGMDGVGLDAVRPQKARQPEAVASRLIGDGDALDRMPGPAGFVAQRCNSFNSAGASASSFLSGWRLNKRGDQPLRLAHFDDGDDRVILLKSGEGPARVKRLRHGTLLLLDVCGHQIIDSGTAP
ncbi:hypothetical protein NKI20_29850 [Mesorhizobium sp. M0830]|uniref:hypothetical protein n=1 Tax=Mesorhizobium sp. M0830 TaxID=2957008 RepID=UPI00333CB13F